MKRVCQQQRRLLWDCLRESLSVPPFTRAFMNFLTLTFRALGAHCHDLGYDSRMTSCLKQSAHNCTVNFSDVGTAHGSRTVSWRQLSTCFHLYLQFFNISQQLRYQYLRLLKTNIRHIEILFPVSILSFSSSSACDSAPITKFQSNWTISDRFMTLCRFPR